MKGIITIILGILFTSIVVLLCFSSWLLASKSDEYWEELKNNMEKRNERR